MDKPELEPIGHKVSKRSGDYQFDDEIIAVIRKRSGELRYVVEDDRGLLLIMSAKQCGLSPSTEAEPHRISAASFQRRVDKWMDACFGDEIKADRLERCDRFLEEALEVCQTEPTFTVDRARAIADYVFSRPVGEPRQEVGGARVTLAALCNAFEIDENEAAETELARVWTKIDAIRAKQATKPTGSALPIAQPAEGKDCGIAVEGLGTDEESAEAVARALCTDNFQKKGAEGSFGNVDDCWWTFEDIARAAIRNLKPEGEGER